MDKVADLPAGVHAPLPGLFVAPCGAVPALLLDCGIARIVRCLDPGTEGDFPEPDPTSGIAELRLAMADEAATDIRAYVQRVADFLRTTSPSSTAEALGDATPLTFEDAPLVVHCHAGQSRSPALTMGLLMVHNKFTLKEALAAFGPEGAVNPNPAFIEQLADLDVALHGADSLDLDAYFVARLEALFPNVASADVTAAYTAASGDVPAARDALMQRSSAAGLDRHQVMVESIHAVVRQEGSAATVEEVREAYERHDRRRDQTLASLLKR